jgi:hypothetical protein
MQNSVLERLLVVDYMTEILNLKFRKLHGKVGLQSRNLMKKVGSVTSFS